MKGKLIIALIALVVLITSPVWAYDPLYLGTVKNQTPVSTGYGSYSDICTEMVNRGLAINSCNDNHKFYVGKSSGTYCQQSAVISNYTPFKNPWAWSAPSACNGNKLIYAQYGRVGSTFAYYEFANWTIVNGTFVAEPNFTGNPLDGYAPLDVVYTVQNYTYVNSSGVRWNFGDGVIQTISQDTFTHRYQLPGIYTVSIEGFDTEGTAFLVTKNNYVLVSNESGAIVNLDVKNAITGALIQDSTVGIKNTTTGVWRNTTAPTGLVYFSTTDPGYLYSLTVGQSITLAANKTGYSSASETFNIPYNNYRARLFLMPSNVVNATGAGTVVANVIRNKDGLTVSGASVVLDSGQMGITNSAGAVTLYNVTAGQRYASVSDPGGGYQSTQYAFNLSAGETKLIVIQLVRIGETPVPTPVSPTPTIAPNTTYDPNDPNSPVYGNKTASQINVEGGAGILGMLSQLIQLWPAVVLGLFIKFWKSVFT